MILVSNTRPMMVSDMYGEQKVTTVLSPLWDFWIIWWIKFWNIQIGEEIKERKLLLEKNPPRGYYINNMFINYDEWQHSEDFWTLTEEEYNKKYPKVFKEEDYHVKPKYR